MMVFISNRKKPHVSAYSGHLKVLKTFLPKEFYIICLNRVVILRTSLSARKLSKLEDGIYRPKHVVFSIANKHHIFIVVFLTEFTSPYSSIFSLNGTIKQRNHQTVRLVLAFTII